MKRFYKIYVSKALLTLIVSMAFVCTTLLTAFAQNKPISGRVTDATGGGIPGASVLIKGTKNGTSTDVNGNFAISAKSDDILVISFTGYIAQEIMVKNQTVINVQLKEESQTLSEVVVVGYGTQSRRNVTNSVAKLDKDVLASAPRSNVGSALQGTVSGLQVVNRTGQPGAGPIILLRGGASINNPGSPLVIVDGVIRDYNDISSENIESIDLLKDASATAIYGARANNGVILITTKQGKQGSALISYKFTGGYNRIRNGYDYLGAKDYIYYTRLGYLNAGRTLAQVNSSRGLGLLTDAANLASFDIRPYTSGTTLPVGWQVVDDPYGGQIMFRDHGGEIQHIVFKNTYTQDHYVNVAGGNEKSKYFAAFDAYNEDGVIVGSNYKRYSGDFNGSFKVRPNVEVSTGVTLSTSSQIGTIGGEVNTLYRSLAIWPTFNPWLDDAKTQPNPGNSASDGNPLYWLGRLDRSNESNKIVANGAVKWDIIPDLYVKVTGNAYLAEALSQSFQKSTQTYANIFANPPSIGSSTRDAINTFSRDFQTQFNGIINYTKAFKEKHNLGAMVGAEYFKVKSYGSRLNGQNAPTDDIGTVNASTTFPAQVGGAQVNYSFKSEYRILSSFARLNYDYDQKYLLTGVFRIDGVSSLPQGNQVGYFPGISAGWNIHNETFFKNSKLNKYISTLKPRISYGANGNIGNLTSASINSTNRYLVQGVYSSPASYDGQGAFLSSSLPNPNLIWEKSKTKGVGLDLGILKDRISLLFDYYDRRTSDLLTNLLFPSYLGYSSITTNSGTLQNRGYEFSANAKVLNTSSGWNVTVGANASYVKNKILQLPYNGQPNNRQSTAAFPLIQIYDPASGQLITVGGLQEGQSMGSIYGYRQVSIFKDAADVAANANTRTDAIAGITGPGLPAGINGHITPGDVNWEDVNGDGIIDSRDQVYLGNIFPKWTGGFNASASYKGVSLYSRFEFALGHTIYNDLVARTLGNYQGTFNYIDLIKQSWSPTNPVTDIPKVYFADQVVGSKQNYTRANNANPNLYGNNSRFYEKGNYLALREVTLSYDFPKELLVKTKFLDHSRIYVTGSNLFYITKFTGPTPEPPIDGNGNATGVYTGTYPTPRTFVLGVQVSF